MMNLGNAYAERIRGDRAENQEAAIAAYRQALEVYTREATPADWARTVSNLAHVYARRIQGDGAKNQEAAIAAYRQALKVYTREAMPHQHRRVQQDLALTFVVSAHWPEAAVAYRGALTATDLLYQAAATPEARQIELAESQNLPARLAYALARSPGAKDTGLQEAVLALERNRARWLRETLSLREDRPPNVPRATWQTFVTQRQTVQELQAESRLPNGTPAKRDFLTLSQALRGAYDALQESIEAIHGVAPDFMPDPTFAQIAAAVRPGRPLVYFAVNIEGTLALIVHKQHSRKAQVHPVWCDLTAGALFDLLTGSGGTSTISGYLGSYLRWQRSPRHVQLARAWLATQQNIGQWLWDKLMGPLTEALLELGVKSAVLLPQGWLGLLPLHAAWREEGGHRRYAMDDLRLIYAPNALSLLAARDTAARVQPDRLLAISEPLPVQANPLDNATPEVTAICAHFDRCQMLAGDQATEKTVRQRLRDGTVLHFACHGSAGFNQPLEGGLLMAHDEILTLREILDLRLDNARLAVLSACETGIPGTELPDEVISLPTGLAQAGVAGVVASLWSVSDLSTMMLMARFYDLWKGQGLEPAEALRRAQLWVRDTSNGEKRAYLEAKLGEDLPDSPAWSRPEENDFSHPFYWAAFTYTGA
jgi:CHAT domain-containing protein